MKQYFLVLFALIVFQSYGMSSKAPKSRVTRAVDVLHSQNLRLFSNGILEYDVVPSQDLLSSFLEGVMNCVGNDRKKTDKCATIRINLSHNLQIKRKDETSLEIIDKITKKVLPEFPVSFQSRQELNQWVEQLREIIKFAKSYSLVT